MSKGFNISEPFEQILKRLSALKNNPELFSEVAKIFEQIKQIEKYTNTAINTLQNYYFQFTRQVDILSSLIDFQTKINYAVSPNEIVNQIFSFLKENVPFQNAFLYLKLNETDQQYEILLDEERKRDEILAFLTNNNIQSITDLLSGRELGVLIGDINADTVKNLSWNALKAKSVILFPIRIKGKLIGFGLLVDGEKSLQLNHLSFINLVSGFISQTIFHHSYLSRLKQRLFKQFKVRRDFEDQGYAKYLEKGPLLILTLDSSGVIIHMNDQALKQVNSEEDLMGKKFLSLVQKDHRKGLQNLLSQMQEGDVKFYRTPVSLTPENEFVLELYFTKMELQNNFIMTIIFGVDITKDYYRNEQQSRNETLDEITRFSQIMNSYWDNFLKVLTPKMGFFKASLKQDDRMEKEFQMFERSVHQTSRLVKSFLEFDLNENEPLIQLNINDVIGDKLKELKQKTLKDIELKYSLDPGVPNMLSYPGKIKKLLDIFYQNSIEAIANNGYILISTRVVNVKEDSVLKPNVFFLHKGKYVEISFKDNGIGIDTRVLSQIFKPFFSTKIRNDGIGLGLFVAYNIVKDLEGEIFVRSKPSEFTEFFVYIPCKGDLEMHEILPGMAEAIKERSPTILVVDDEFNIRSMLKEVFEMNGYSVFTAANGKEGIDIFRKHSDQIDLIILDMVMPVMDGKSAFFEIKKLNKSQKIIIISGYAKKEDLREILDKGALAFMSKPFQIESIVEKVSEYLNSN